MNDFNSYKIPFFTALIIHVIIIVFLFVQLPVHSLQPTTKQPANIVHAVVVNQQQVKQEVDSVKAEYKRQQTLKTQKLKKLRQQKALAAKQRREQKRIAALKKKREQHAKKLAQEKALALRRKKAAQRKAKLAARRKKRIAEKKRKEEKAREKRLAEKKKREAEAAKKRKLAALKAKRRAAQAKAKAERLAKEKARLAAARAKAEQKEIDKYKAMIVQTISRNWLVPSHLTKNLHCQLLIKVGPGGVVLSVQVIKPSGDAVLDRSARTAVFKSSPLPVPKDGLFDKFRTLRLTVKPEMNTNKPAQIVL